MRTFTSEAKRVVGQYVPGDPPTDRLAHALVWVLYARGDLKKHLHRNRGKTAQRQRPFYGGTYRPPTRQAARGSTNAAPAEHSREAAEP